MKPESDHHETNQDELAWRHEMNTLRLTMGEAEELAQEGQPLEGHAALRGGLHRAQELSQRSDAPSWARGLAARWRVAAEMFAERWKVSSEE